MMKKRRRGEKTVRVLAYNIRHGEGMDGAIDLARIANVISRLEPDVVALQEIDNGAARTGYVDQMKQLAGLTGMRAAFGKFMDYAGGEYGMGVLSAHSIVDASNYELPQGSEPRSALAARILIEDLEQDILLVGIHLFETAEERMAQAQELVELFKDETVPTILAGDFNTEPDEEVMGFLEEYWVVPSKGDDRLSWPADKPEVEIDYVMYRPADRFQVLTCRLIDEPVASDHRPLLADLRLW